MKVLKKLLVTTCSVALLFIVTWTAYYLFIVRPHISENVVLIEKKAYETNFDLYGPAENVEYKNKPYDNYAMFVPRFGNFVFYFGCATAINSKPDDTTESMTGSNFDYNMNANVNPLGKISNYKFTVFPFTDPDDKYDERCSLVISPNGELLNKEELSEKSINIYNDAKDEILSIINTSNELFGF
jgi:hypothetical protein